MSISIIIVVLLFPDFAVSLVNKDAYELISPYLFDSYTTHSTKKCGSAECLLIPARKQNEL
jgi:hypothetical protein